jgi:prepilin-type N-terminal cleavage/methylation domain-containing protein
LHISPTPPAAKSVLKAGFTLIELSIALVIIGLLVGGVLVGQDLIRAAQVRATISQIEKYNTATNIFKAKYGYLPGDITSAAASQFGLITRSGCAGDGDGNGLIESAGGNNFSSANLPGCLTGNGGSGGGSGTATGEEAIFWVDLGTVGLIDNGIQGGAYTYYPAGNQDPSLYMPAAKLGNGFYIGIWSGDGWGWSFMGINTQNPGTGANYFFLANVTTFTAGWTDSASVPVKVAYLIDSKMDDGLPQSGNVLAMYAGENGGGPAILWADPANTVVTPSTYAGYTGATPGTATSCFDNSASGIGTPGVLGAVQHYSVEINNGAGPNCALSFKFQ